MPTRKWDARGAVYVENRPGKEFCSRFLVSIFLSNDQIFP
jgi:hypothetical protein